MSNWVTYTGSDEQINEIENSKSGFILRSLDVCEIPAMEENPYMFQFGKDFDSTDDLKEYLGRFLDNAYYFLCNPHPLAAMICQQARTGQPVWVKMKSSTYWVIAMRGFDLIYQDHVVSVIKSTTPDWNIPGAEYSFTEFKDDRDRPEQSFHGDAI